MAVEENVARVRKAIALDFDGCLCADAYPAIGQPNWDVINRAKRERQAGAGLILWTCREDRLLLDAVAACESWGLRFDAVNESLPDWIEAFKTQPRKVGATEYWDDKAVRMPTAQKDEPLTLEELQELKYNEPIWIEFLSPDRPDYLKSQWHLFCSVNYTAKTWYPDGALCLCTGGALDLSKCGKTWLAYRRKPEGTP